MAAYIIADIEVTDAEGYLEYKRLAGPTLEPYGGRFAARAGQTEVLEGDWTPHRLILLEFPSLERAKAWWDSPEYREARRIRQQTARTNLIVIEGT